MDYIQGYSSLHDPWTGAEPDFWGSP